MYHPKHRARSRHSLAPVASVGALSLAVAAVLGPAAYADETHWTTDGSTQGSSPHSPFGPKNPPGQNQGAQAGNGAAQGDADDANGPNDDESEVDEPGGQQSSPATNGGSMLPGDAGVLFALLKPTAQPLTAFELPFACGEVWTGTTRPGHSPSPRSVDFNRAGDLGAPVVAAAGGTVVTAVTGKKKRSYGQYVVLDHGNGESTMYAHLDTVLVAVGQVVTVGTQLGTVGNTGNSSGPHLHFEERVGGKVVDAWFHGTRYPVGSAATSLNCGTAPVLDIPLAGDMYGSKAAEIVVFRRGDPGTFVVARARKGQKVITMGGASDQPLLGDWDGDGRVNPGVRTPSTRLFELRVRGKDTEIKFGKAADVPVAGNWDGVGSWEVGVRRPGSAKFLLRAADGTVTKVALGDSDDLPVTGDWNGDGVTDLGVFDSMTATFTLRTVDATGAEVLTQVQFGTPGVAGVVPVPADWDGNGITDLGTWNPVSQTFYQRKAASPASKKHTLGREQYRR